jgi:hypothetical protein
MKIPIVMISGAVNSGKTLFALTIDPNCRRSREEVEPTTIVWDQEGSADTYAGSLNFEHKDTRAAVAAGVHGKVMVPADTDPRWLKILKSQADCNDSPAAAMFRAWYFGLLSVPAGKYAVGICDTFTPLQDGMVDWLRRHPEAFGRTINEYTKASSMTLWPDCKAMLSHILAVDCRLRFSTFVINLHLKNEWAGGAKTGKQVAEGLDVLEKLATLHLELDRAPKEKGKDAPRVPAAIVKKERLVRFGAIGEEDKPILPPRIPQCTPDAIRKYIATPPDFAKLEAGERLPDTSMNSDERLRMQATIAADERVAAETRLSALEMARQAAEAGRAAMAAQAVAMSAGATVAAPAPVQQAANGNGNGSADDNANGNGNGHSQSVKPITAQQGKEMMNLFKELFSSGPEAGKWMMENHGTTDPQTLTETQAMGVLSDLNGMKAAKQRAAIQTPAAEKPNGQAASTEPEHCTTEQRGKIRELTQRIYGEQAEGAQKAWLTSIGCGAPMGLTFQQAQLRIVDLEKEANQMVATARSSDEDIPF